MRILQVISSIDRTEGGPATFALELNSALRRIGHTAELATIGLDAREIAFVDSQQHEFVHLHVPSQLPPKTQASMHLRRWLSDRVNEFDIVHVDGLYRMNSLYAHTASVRAGVPYVVMPHGVLEPYQREVNRGSKKLWDRVAGKRILRSSQGIICASESERLRIQQWLLAPLRTYVIGLGVGKVPPARVEAVDRFLAKRSIQQSPVFLFLGRLAAKKNPDRLLRAWASAFREDQTSARLIVAGPDGDHSALKLRELCAQLSIQDSVLFTGHVTPNEAAYLYALADVFVLPSDNENFGMTVPEAMAYGCAVIATDAVASSTHVASAGGGLVLRSPDVKVLSASFRMYAGDMALSSLHGARNATYAADIFSWESVAGEFAVAYASAIADSRRPA